MITSDALRFRDELFSLIPADLACYAYGMDYRQDAQHSPCSLAAGRQQPPEQPRAKTLSHGTKLPMVGGTSQNHSRWYSSPFSAFFDQSESMMIRGIAVACLVSCLAVSATAFAASPAASPSVLPFESRGVTRRRRRSRSIGTGSRRKRPTSCRSTFRSTPPIRPATRSKRHGCSRKNFSPTGFQPPPGSRSMDAGSSPRGCAVSASTTSRSSC